MKKTMTKPYRDTYIATIDEANSDAFETAYKHYQETQDELHAMWEEAWNDWSCQVREKQLELMQRGWEEEEAYQCALYELGTGPKEVE